MTYYGMDLYGRPRLAELLRELNEVEGLDWIRVLYNYPNHFTDDLYDALASCSKVLPYLDMPLQHINDRMLKVMNRRHTRARDRGDHRPAPGLGPRTWSSGPRSSSASPARTEAEFEESARLRRVGPKFERLGVFPYSLEPDTPAARLPNHLPDEVKAERRDRVMAAQQGIAFDFNRALVGRKPWTSSSTAPRPGRGGTSGRAGAMPTPRRRRAGLRLVPRPGAGRPRQVLDPRRRRLRPRRPARGGVGAPAATGPAQGAEEAGRLAVHDPELIHGRGAGPPDASDRRRRRS